MKRLIQGSIVQIPLLHGLGFAYGKYIDLTKIDHTVSFPEILKIFNIRSTKAVEKSSELELKEYLITPILVAGLRPTLRDGFWQNIGSLELEESDFILPDFKEGNSSDSEIEKDKWYHIKDCKKSLTTENTFDNVKYLQPFLGEGTGNIEIRLTMYFILKEGKRVEDFFNMDDINVQRKYNQVLDSPLHEC
ncbi:hypothetical protein C9994_06515 [Marivirga lumbricoides]|uniref:Uncharacterized protein n=1 Tax=Marivirga lumbricoides TaxID=1046115 RepID=A0A2T4DS34_9BACT|nr:hypothetical protein C9994_06515 [Marivirga lumbricoides]